MPVDYRIYGAPNGGLAKNDHFAAMVAGASRRGFRPRAVLFDGWYSSLANLKQVRGLGWTFFTQLKSNRRVDVDRRLSRNFYATGVMLVRGQGCRRPRAVRACRSRPLYRMPPIA